MMDTRSVDDGLVHGIVLAAGEGRRLQRYVQEIRSELLPKQYVNLIGRRSAAIDGECATARRPNLRYCGGIQRRSSAEASVTKSHQRQSSINRLATPGRSGATACGCGKLCTGRVALPVRVMSAPEQPILCAPIVSQTCAATMQIAAGGTSSSSATMW